MLLHSSIEGTPLCFLLIIQVIPIFTKDAMKEIGTENEVRTPECNEGVDVLLFNSASLTLEKSLRVVYVSLVKMLDFPLIRDNK